MNGTVILVTLSVISCFMVCCECSSRRSPKRDVPEPLQQLYSEYTRIKRRGAISFKRSNPVCDLQRGQKVSLCRTVFPNLQLAPPDELKCSRRSVNANQRGPIWDNALRCGTSMHTEVFLSTDNTATGYFQMVALLKPDRKTYMGPIQLVGHGALPSPLNQLPNVPGYEVPPKKKWWKRSRNKIDNTNMYPNGYGNNMNPNGNPNNINPNGYPPNGYPPNGYPPNGFGNNMNPAGYGANNMNPIPAT